MTALPPPGPDSPRLAQTVQFLRDPIGFATRCHAAHGDLFRLRLLGLGDWVFVCSPELTRELFKSDDTQLAGGAANRHFIGEMMGPNATFSLDGTEHDLRRRLILPHLSGRRLLEHLPLLLDATDSMIDAWPVHRPFSLLAATNRLTLEIIVRAVFGGLPEPRHRALFKHAEVYFEQGLRSPFLFFKPLQVDLGRFSPWGRVLRQRRALFDRVGAEVDAVLAGRGGDGLLARLAGETKRDGTSLSRDALVDECVNLLFGAQESTGKILAWTLLSLLHHPRVLTRARAEVMVITEGHPITAEHVPRLDYLDAVVKEGMRTPPTSPFAGVRRALRTTRIGDFEIPAGTTVTHGFGVMTQARSLFETPDTFDPERHFHGRRVPPYTFNPFGGGKRMCIGKSFAQFEIKTILATILQRVELEVQNDSLETVRDGFLVTPKDGGQVILRSRRPRVADDGPSTDDLLDGVSGGLAAAAAAAGCPFHAARGPGDGQIDDEAA
ncbi:MAG: cytochrome P450 [Acidobacteriota bacterium]